MRWKWAVVVLGSMALGCSHNKSGEGAETKMTLDEVPAPARSTMMQEAGGAKIGTIDKEEKNGKTIYETDVMSGGKNWEIKVDAAGNVVSKKIDNESEEKHGKKEKDED